MLGATLVSLVVCLVLVQGMILNQNVVFEKINTITTTRAQWTVTFVIDIKPYSNVLKNLNENLMRVSNFSRHAVRQCCNVESERYGPAFQKLSHKIEILLDFHAKLTREFNEYHILSREKRSLLPFIGDALHYLFGTTSSKEVNKIENRLNDVELKQKEIVHVLEENLSIIDVSRAEIAENRHSLTQMAKELVQIRDRTGELVDDLMHNFFYLESFLSTYTSLDLIIDELDKILQSSIVYMDHLQLQLNMLSLGHLAPSTISPAHLKTLLREIENQLRMPLSLPGDPERDLWRYYQFLKCSTVLRRNKIIVIVPVPLLDSNNKFDIYKTHTLPSPYIPPKENGNLKPMSAEFELEADAIAVDEGRTRIALLTAREADACSNPVAGFCAIGSPVYSMGLSEFCLSGLFTNNSKIIENSCHVNVRINARLPRAKYLSNGNWLVSTNERLQFSVSCPDESVAFMHVNPPVKIIKLGAGCTAINDRVTLTPYYQKESRFQINSSLIYSQINLIEDKLWTPFRKTVQNITRIKVPTEFHPLSPIPMKHLLSRIRQLNAKKAQGRSVYFYVLIGSGIALAAVLIIVIVYKTKLLNKYLKCTNILRLIKGKSGASGALESTLQSAATHVAGAISAPSASSAESTSREPMLPETGKINFYPQLG